MKRCWKLAKNNKKKLDSKHTASLAKLSRLAPSRMSLMVFGFLILKQPPI